MMGKFDQAINALEGVLKQSNQAFVVPELVLEDAQKVIPEVVKYLRNLGSEEERLRQDNIKLERENKRLNKELDRIANLNMHTPMIEFNKKCVEITDRWGTKMQAENAKLWKENNSFRKALNKIAKIDMCMPDDHMYESACSTVEEHLQIANEALNDTKRDS